MTTKRITVRALAGLTLLAGFGVSTATALPPAPKPEEMAAVQPKQPGVAVTTPAAADLPRLRVEPVPGGDGKPVGYVLLDGTKPVRRFVAVGSENFNILSFYLDGQEVYRETDTKKAGRIDQYRWLGAAGSKIGYDVDGNGSIDVWQAITPEEVSREVFEAMIRDDPKRIEAMLPSVVELQAMGLPAEEIQKIRGRAENAVKRTRETAAALKLTDKAKWIHLELWAPEATPFDAFGGKMDVVRHRNGGVLVDRGDGKSADVFQLGELVQFGGGWRLIDGPAAGNPQPPTREDTGGQPVVPVPEVVKDLVAKLQGMKPEDHAGRAAVLEEIVTKLQGNASQADWIKQLLEAYTSAAETGDKAAGDRLLAWKKSIDQNAAKTPLAGFAAFRAMGIDYARRLKDATKPEDVATVQKWWREQLEAFVKDYPSIEETPEALFRLGMASEFAGRDGEAAAKQHYGTLARSFPKHPLAAQAEGAVRRLDSEGQPFQLAGPNLANGQAVNVSALTGKVVVVYYWASWYQQLKPEAQQLAELLKKHAGKLEVVTISLDQTQQQAAQAINAAGLPGQHLFQPGGALATAYGVMGPHVFLIGKDGKVANKNAQMPMLADEVERLLK